MPSPSSVPENDKRSSNIAQRIEEGLWRYSLSGNVIKRWLLEIICWWVSAICMAVIIGFLVHYKGKRIPNWPGSLTLNAFIAILSKVSGAALILPVSEALGQLKWTWFQGHSKTMWDFEIFDNASRGPWGSFLLLIRTKGKALAALGALITLFSLALDPFFQQVVDFPDRWALQGTNSSIPRAIAYDPRYTLELRAGQIVAQQDQDIYVVAKKFFYENGTQPVEFGNGTRAEIPISCPTSNCTWPPHQTLGVCSKCADISSMLEFRCLNTTIDWVANLTAAGSEGKYVNGSVCGHFLIAPGLPGPPIMMSGYLKEDITSPAGRAKKGETLLTRMLPLVDVYTKRPLLNGSIHFKNVRNPINDFLVVSTANGVEGVLRNDTPVAHECVLSWCVKTMQSSYFLASFEEKVIETFENNTEGPTPWSSSPLTSQGLSGADIWYNENVTIRAPRAFKSSDIIEYGVVNSTFTKVASVFDDIFPSYYTATSPSSIPILRYKTYITNAPFQKTLDFNPWLGAANNNVTLHMERLATALTNVVRSVPNNPRISGDAFSTVTYVEVRWEWLALPLALLALTLVFLVATIRKTAKEGVWKTSAIATLLYGLPDEMQKKITNSANEGTPRAKAKELRVNLDSNKGWRVSGNLFSPLTPKPKQYQPPPGWI
ncbi:hypothetical protein DM02DRAFT_545137 [Periconia macrospinosa]|uniref:DUF3176 domain containing protein n=1 Tax=Periconia macrospinosa TaxID=97972 RepID=A0A2V1D2D2_9PLEO|nr:hypothetical protein DM02DRAFT_545137 [Periconia macrospinosa]